MNDRWTQCRHWMDSPKYVLMVCDRVLTANILRQDDVVTEKLLEIVAEFADHHAKM